jgi:DNA-binding GntR family transcriptional regulator
LVEETVTMPQPKSTDRKSRVKRGETTALYEQIRRSILADIWKGLYSPGDLLPSESELGSHFGVNRLTVRQAVHRLANEGFVRPLHGRGYQVTSATLSGDFLTTPSLSHYLQELGLETETRILSQEVVEADSEVATALELKAGAPTIQILRQRLVLNAPIAVEEAYYDAEKYKRLIDLDISRRSLLETLYRDFGIRVARVTTELRAEQADGRAELLGIAPTNPLLVAKTIMYDLNNDPIECGLAYYHTERVQPTFKSIIAPRSWPYDALPSQASDGS